MKPWLSLFAWAVCALIPSLHAATTTLVAHSDNWLYRKGTNQPQADWKTAADNQLDPATWLGPAPGGFGYGDGDDGTVLGDMQNKYTTVFIRRSFDIAAPIATNLTLQLVMDWDDGYVAYLDGVEIARDRAPGAPGADVLYTAEATSDHSANVEGGLIVTNTVGPATDWLGVGTHVLALIGINGDAPSSDLTLKADLILDEIIVEPPPTNSVPLGGTLAADTTLYASNQVYAITSDVTVPAGVTLTVEPGVSVQFMPGTGMNVLGRLLAIGTEADPIAFTRAIAGTTWERILFIQAEDSAFHHCIIEFSNCEGDHKDYYDNDGDISTQPPSRTGTYFQAISAIATHLEMEHCQFRNLPDESSGGQGDAIAIISDDPDNPGTATAFIRHCTFTGIGQAIHTRYSFVLVENSRFTFHNGDNDDIDLYGESFPPSLIVNNTFLDPNADDAMNPTQSSAIMIGNIAGHTGTGRQGDSGVVLRDRCCPVMINNVIFNCNSAGIDIQNTCDALLVNNTIINCGNGINFRDHTGRWGAPYFLTPGAAKATIINTIVWDCSTSLNLVDSPSANLPGSIATIRYSNVEGGQGSASVSANSSLTWEPSNINANPLFANLAGNDYHLTAGSPCIDAGTAVNEVVTITNHAGLMTNLTFVVTNDLDGLPRPLDGDGDGTAAFDIGSYELLLATADSNGDGVPDGWYQGFGLNPVDPTIGANNKDNDVHSNRDEWVADTDPTDPDSFFKIESISVGPPVVIQYLSSSNRRYTLVYTPGLGDGDGSSVVWTEVTGAVDQPGSGGLDSLTDSNVGDAGHYKVEVSTP